MTNNLLAALGNFLHLYLNGSDIFISDNIVTQIHIIVETFCNNRSNPELSLRIEMFDCLSHQMCTGMVQHFQLFIFFKINHCTYLLLSSVSENTDSRQKTAILWIHHF